MPKPEMPDWIEGAIHRIVIHVAQECHNSCQKAGYCPLDRDRVAEIIDDEYERWKSSDRDAERTCPSPCHPTTPVARDPLTQ